MATSIEARVWDALYNNFQEADYIFPKMSDLTGALGPGDTMKIPYHSAAPTDAVATTRAAPESYAPSDYTLSLDQDVFYNISLPALETPQRLNGAWASEVAKRFAFDAKNAIDANLIDYLNTSLAYDATGTYHVNPLGDALTNGDIMEAIALVESNTGRRRNRFMFVLHPYGAAAVNDVSSFIPAQRNAELGDVGLPLVGTIGGIPAVVSTQVNRLRTVATTAVSVTSNVATATVAAGHGIVAGMSISTTGHTTNATDATVSSVTATTVLYPLTACDGALADGIGTITIQSAENLLIDRDSVWVALQKAPMVRRVPDPESAGDALQLFTSFGRVGAASGICVLSSPPSAV